MKGNIFAKSILFFGSFLLFSQTFAAGDIDHFEVVLGKDTAKINEALDLTITAVDKNGQTVTDYTGDVLVFSESDKKAEFPNDLTDNSYTFQKTDNGSVKFENAVVFKTAGVQDVYVYDLLSEDIYGYAQATITEGTGGENLDISIISPENGVSLGKNALTVSGVTQKNHQVEIMVNGTQKLETTSDENGNYEMLVENLAQGTNTFVAQVLDSDNNVVGTSDSISVKIDAELPEFKRITITPTGEVTAGSDIHIEVVSNSKLSEVTAMINDIIIKLSETKDGIYSADTKAPNEAGSYPVDVNLKNEFANTAQEKGVETLVVVAPEMNAAEPENPVLAATGAVQPDLSIKNIKLTKLKTKSILTWDVVSAAESYNIYKKTGSGDTLELVTNVTEPKFEVEITGDEIKYEDFAIKAVAKDGSGNTYEGDLSDMTQIQTGPELYLLFALAAIFMSSGIFYFRKKQLS